MQANKLETQQSESDLVRIMPAVSRQAVMCIKDESRLRYDSSNSDNRFAASSESYKAMPKTGGEVTHRRDLNRSSRFSNGKTVVALELGNAIMKPHTFGGKKQT
jgi:hypothetical protein